ncbi:30S ribosomal protein THX [Aquiflexum sp. LQ15W]|nr:30S ribosomal protein THX [Cognataquiflexum nitidum]MCH6201290.1 30S ribosomal protein THX [Cognataquiflexum nitidum]
MGKGDIKSRKGKIKIGSFGASRPKSKRNVATKKIKLGLPRK